MKKLIWQCLFSPRLYKIYDTGFRGVYTPGRWERIGDTVVTCIRALFIFTYYTSPVICMYLYIRGLSYYEFKYFGSLCTGLTFTLGAASVLRAYARAHNPKYVRFLEHFNAPRDNKANYFDDIRKYDFDFNKWPVTFAATSRSRLLQQYDSYDDNTVRDLPIHQRVPLKILAFIATHLFAVRLIYPGSMIIMQNVFWTPIFQGRCELVQKYDGKRAKIMTPDGNSIDTMYVKNQSMSRNSKTLVICCEGNSGFYELGIIMTPLKSGFSALGWNHPGFCGSTGNPYPEQECNAIDAVIQYAIMELKYQPKDIVLFGWSIGGYTATWGAVNYDVKALILDATFDDLLPLAEKQMPSLLSLIVKDVVRSYVNLNIGDLITRYNGAVQLIRRIDDEIICLRPGDMSTNCGNKLVLRLIQQRHASYFINYPELSRMLENYICLSQAQRAELNEWCNDNTEKLALRLILKYHNDYDSTHCTPLPEYVFTSVLDKVLRTTQFRF